MAFARRLRILRFSYAVLALWICLLVGGCYVTLNRLKDAFTRPSTSVVPPVVVAKYRDWHDYAAMRRDEKREGLGEQGRGAHIVDPLQKKLELKMSLENGFNALLSDYISVNRSLRDIRPKGCQAIKYLSKLPTVSVVIPFYNEHYSVLLRSVHSLLNRSPPELLRQIILVDDGSTREYLHRKLDSYVAQHFHNVHILRQPKRSGLITARLAGARMASSEVLVFFDSHIEASHNWLPPLLDPIAKNRRTVVCPFIDVIEDKTLAYVPQDDGARGGFDWHLNYKRLQLLPSEVVDRTKPFPNPVMAGGLFAIARSYFWELGGYDEGLEIWGGEQYELSFKIWMCGGEMYDVPCSRVGHIFRGKRVEEKGERQDNFVNRNYKRVAEVWMDEYRHVLYKREPEIYDKIDAGDLSERKALRSRLKCKSFHWFLTQVAKGQLQRFPLEEPPNIAGGLVQNVGKPSMCVDALNGEEYSEVGVFYCDNSGQNTNQNWTLTWRHDLRCAANQMCLDTNNGKMILLDCHENGGNQYFHYNTTSKWLVPHPEGEYCMRLDPVTDKLEIADCDPDDLFMQWTFSKVNETALLHNTWPIK